jgi:hypothetical protein
MVHVRCLEGRAIMRQSELRLSKQDRHKVEEFRSRGSHMAREVNRAHILAALDDGVAENQIMAVLGVGRTAIWRTRAAYREAGLEFALRDVARPGKPRQYARRRRGPRGGLGLLRATARG